MRHIILGGFHGQEHGRLIWIGKTGGLGCQGPKQLYHALGQAADGQQCGHAASGQAGRTQYIRIGGAQGALRNEHQDGIPCHAGFEQTQQAGNPGGSLAGSGRAFQEEAGVGRFFNDAALRSIQRVMRHNWLFLAISPLAGRASW